MVGTKSHGYSNSGRLSEGDTRCRFFCTCHSPSLQHHEVLKKKEQETFTANMILHTYTLKPMSVPLIINFFYFTEFPRYSLDKFLKVTTVMSKVK